MIRPEGDGQLVNYRIRRNYMIVDRLFAAAELRLGDRQRVVRIPQGARLLGEYDSRIAAGQSRLLLAWTRLMLPDGRSIVLERQPGTDQAGYAGLEDGVDNHWDRMFLAAGLATFLNIGLETGRDGDDEIAEAIREMVTRDLVLEPRGDAR